MLPSSGASNRRPARGRGAPLQAWVPRAPVQDARGRGSGRPNPPRQAEPSRDVPLLVQEIQEKLSTGSVECMICYDMVRRSAAVWSCSSCYSIFHLACIRKWARSPTSNDTSAAESHVNWRCPGCQSVQLTPARHLEYRCFCGSRRDPPNDLYLTPHSCGEPCGKPLAPTGAACGDDLRCPHHCVLPCHPGPCPPCKAFAPARSCPCGKKSIVRRCSDRNSPLTCGQLCNKRLGCGRHRCRRLCHTGPCETCPTLITALCFCEKKTEALVCGDMVLVGEIKAEVGIFSCAEVCGKTLGCGNHTCMDVCHPGPCGQCELLPDKVKTCHCGKTKLEGMRGSCLDPIPTCSEVCGKLLPCDSHICGETCHEGSCPPCLVKVNQKCRCGSMSRRVECFKTFDEGEVFVCEKPCGRKKNCGRHRCSERCCPLSSSSTVERFSGDWDPHLCQMPCEKKLRCGQHSCQSLCHSGHCPPCLETIFSELSCACGRTSLPPPLPCGTPYPSCQHPCVVPQPCGHPTTHTCHFGDCPPCSMPVAKECCGGHVVLRNIPCGSKDIRCNQLCGRPRQCGMHACSRTCHPPPCDSNSNPNLPSNLKLPCGQACGAPRKDCKHTCISPCHPSVSCPDIRCEYLVSISCSCGRIVANVPCGSGATAGGYSSDSVYDASIIRTLPVPLLPVETNGKRVPIGQRKLACDEECEKMERKRVLADAFDITPPNLDALHFGENTAVSDMLGDIFRREPKWVVAVEERFKFLVLGKAKGASSSNLKVHVFCPMMKDKRDVVRHMAERWKLTVNGAGWEPKRFLVVHVTPKSKPPARILGSKAGLPVTAAMQPPAFDALVDMDPRLVISLLDLPREADISALVLRFGGECELVWMNDKNALAVFSDPVRAATALRRLDHGSPYHGAVTLVQRQNDGHLSFSTAMVGGASGAWGVGNKDVVTAQPRSGNPWKKVVEAGPATSAPAGSEPLGELDAALPVWRANEVPVPLLRNRWDVLETSGSMNISNMSSGITPSILERSGADVSEPGERSRDPSIAEGHGGYNPGPGGMQVNAQEDAVDNWEEVYH